MTIILKHSGNYVYDDYLQNRAVLRVKELTDVNPVQTIIRSKTKSEPVAYLVKSDWYDAQSPSSPLPIKLTSTTDDYLGFDLSKMVNIINGIAEVTSEMREIVNEGPAQDHFKAYAVMLTKEFYKDTSDIVSFDTALSVGGVAVAYLVNPVLYAAIAP